MSTNPEIDLAWQCIAHTGAHLFLTGKAGTGKTTFLRQLKAQSPKRMIVVAPTGIAAINAGGVTIHSFFQLSFAPFIPDATFTAAKPSYKFSKEKVNIIRSLDLLVIDEISMVRADQLDAIDAVLRRYRDHFKPFGGVQLLMIGDLQQLAPVIKDEEWALLNRYYETPFFFGSRALRETEYITIQLQKVYRQSDDRFLSLLNRVRENTIDQALLNELNKRYIPNFHPNEEEGYVRLTTHNYQAQRINEQNLMELPGRAYVFKANVQGNFPESSYPADHELHVKKGAQIMFIKNDSSGEKRYYNGKIGVVTAVDEHRITVWGQGDQQEIVLLQEVWENSKYTLNPTNNEIKEEVEGTFKQYPIRLAWGITIHKSQGLTFDRAIIDAKMSFAHGQVYVALSRCRTLEGLVLGSPLTLDSIITDQSIGEYTSKMADAVPDAERLEHLKHSYYLQMLDEQFSYAQVKQSLYKLHRLLDEYLYQLYPKTLAGYTATIERFNTEIEKVFLVFRKQYTELMMQPDYAENSLLQERLRSAARYFHDKTDEILLTLLRKTKITTDNKEVRQRFDAAFSLMHEQVVVKMATLSDVLESGFSVSGYLQSKAKAILSLQKPTTTKTGSKSRKQKNNAELKTEKIEVGDDISNPTLYNVLIQWRKNEASRQGIPAYMILRQKALLGIVNELPTTKAALLKIPYLGNKAVAKYGDAIIALVEQHA